MKQKLFPKFMKAVEALESCCESSNKPIAKSEVYNETWLLRLTLAAINDYEGNFKCSDKNDEEPLKDTRTAVQCCWISEGGLGPAFERERTTWTDAILGSVRLNKDVSKRGIEVDNNESGGITIIEAKIGSKLSPGVTNSKNYNQAARNIACLAKLILPYENLHNKCHFLVFSPEKGKIKKEFIEKENINDIIENEKRDPKDIQDKEKFHDVVESIRKNSRVIFWGDIIKSMQSSENKTELETFYKKCLSEYGLEK